MKWIIGLLDYRLWNGAGQGGGGGGPGGDGQGGGGEPGYGSQRQQQRAAPVAAPVTAPEPEPPPEEPGPITHAQFARGLEDVRQRNRVGPMPAMAQDYEIPDTAFGSRIY